MSRTRQYECVIGLEVHAQLLTRSKAFSRDEAAYGAAPNTLVSPVSLGHPGTLPCVNEAMVEMAVLLGLATHCKIRKLNRFARKNYFYADLPKGYQISQYETPICEHGFINITVNGEKKRIGITRIHMEEDSGKSIHDLDPFYTLIDLNRAGVPLLEIVSEPDMRSPEEAYEYLTEIRKLVRYLGICDGNMEEGSLRCDANVSVRLAGSSAFGQKVEVKNMNSIRNVRRALEYEIQRQVELIESGGKVEQDTRSFDAEKGITFTMRTKEEAHDYRYFTEPDLPPVVLTDEFIQKVREQMPPLPEELYDKYVKEYDLTGYDAGLLTSDKATALYFESVCAHTSSYKAAANWVMGPVRSWLNEKALGMDSFPVAAATLARMVDLVESGQVSFSAASREIFPELLQHPEADPEAIARAKNLIQESDEEALMKYIRQALAAYPDKVEAYRQGKKGLLGLFMGEVMKRSKGKADPKKASELLRKELES